MMSRLDIVLLDAVGNVAATCFILEDLGHFLSSSRTQEMPRVGRKKLFSASRWMKYFLLATVASVVDVDVCCCLERGSKKVR
jgi:hypothetical protein